MEMLVLPMMLLTSASAGSATNTNSHAKVQVMASARIIEAEIISLDAHMIDENSEFMSGNHLKARSYTVHIQTDATELHLTEFH